VPDIVTRDAAIEAILDGFDQVLGRDRRAYRGHVYRVFNFTRALAPEHPELDRSSAVAAAFHDVGIWADATVDYLGPSIRRAREYLEAGGRSAECDLVARMIDFHHKLAPYRGPEAHAVEAFRRADLVDLSLGTIRFGLPRSYVSEVRRALPNAGFHACLGRVLGTWFLHHPLRPLPMMKL
jgi:hypothetical protein